MTKTIKVSLYVSIVVLGLFVSIFWMANRYIPTVAQYQINQIIKKHDIQKMERISTNKKTENLLTSLKANDCCKEVSDFQGGTKEIGYYTAKIKNNNIGIYMQKDENLYWKWKIKKIWCLD